MAKMFVKKGDKVVVIAGKDKGKTANVLEVSPSDNKVLVEGVNVVKRHQKPRSQEEFNRNKRPHTKGWQTLAFYYNVKSWRNLLKALDLPLYFEMARDRKPANITVNIYTDYDFRD